jgi:predicted regulator of Ras-like GTPase activity (Roadblock/LC7/MglB family)
MENIIGGLAELEGVRGTFLFGSNGQVVRRKAHPMYDQALLNEAARFTSKAIDSLQLHHSDWDAITIHYSEGKLILRNLGPITLALICDASINLSFANVAINVAVKKLKQAIDAGALDQSAPPAAMGQAGLSDASPVDSGLSFSGVGTSGVGPPVITDQATTAFLSRCTKALAKSVGPMAKVFVKEAIRTLARDGKFMREQIPQLIKMLEDKIEIQEDRAQFRQDVGVY